jgi:hypothetical protein
VPSQPLYLVAYRPTGGQVDTVFLRIRSDVTDLAADARRQLVGKRCHDPEILLIEPAVNLAGPR